MKKSQRKARAKALKQRHKQRRKESRTAECKTETAQPAPETTEEPQMENKIQEAVFTTDEIRGALRAALGTVQKVMGMVNKAIDAVDEEDADKVFAAQVTSQRQRYDFRGVRSDEASIIRVHPLFAFWKLAERCAKQIETLLRLTSPREFAKWKAEADKVLRDIKKLESKAQKAAA